MGGEHGVGLGVELDQLDLVAPELGEMPQRRPRILLGEQVAKRLEGRPAAVLGFAETATGLGH